MEDVRNEAVRGFIGNHFNEAVINDKKYFVFINGKHFYVISKGPLSERSEFNGYYYVTDFTINELEDLYSCKMTAVYRGYRFNTGRVSRGIEEIELLADHDPDIPLEELGFEYDYGDRVTHKTITASEADSISVHRESIYEKARAYVKEKYKAG